MSIAYGGTVPILVTYRAGVYRDIDNERNRQNAKWRAQKHLDSIWQTILTEEVGEAAQEVLTHELGVEGHGDLREELIHIAAVAVACIECLDGRSSDTIDL